MNYSEVMAKLIKAEDEISFSAGKHQYRLSGRWVPSVSSIKGLLDKPALSDWKARMQVRGTARHISRHPNPKAEADRLAGLSDEAVKALQVEFEGDAVAQRAADLGTEVHSLIEAWAKAKLRKPFTEPEVSDGAHFLFEKFIPWATEVELAPLASEMRLASRVFAFAGTTDLLGLVRGELTDLDWKCKSGPLWPEEILQLAAYRYCIEEATGVVVKAKVLRIPKDGSAFQVLDPDDACTYKEALAAFLSLRGVSDWLRNMRRNKR